MQLLTYYIERVRGIIRKLLLILLAMVVFSTTATATKVDFAGGYSVELPETWELKDKALLPPSLIFEAHQKDGVGLIELQYLDLSLAPHEQFFFRDYENFANLPIVYRSYVKAIFADLAAKGISQEKKVDVKAVSGDFADNVLYLTLDLERDSKPLRAEIIIVQDGAKMYTIELFGDSASFGEVVTTAGTITQNGMPFDKWFSWSTK